MKRPRLVGPWSLWLVDGAVRGGMPRKQERRAGYGFLSIDTIISNGGKFTKTRPIHQ
jgi:hypothetical protein